MKTLVLFPNNVFSKKYLPPYIDNILIVEEPLYYNLAKTEIKVLYRAAQKYQYDYLKRNLVGVKIKYVNLMKKPKLPDCLFVFDDPDLPYVFQKYQELVLSITVLPSPSYLMTCKDLFMQFDSYADFRKHYKKKVRKIPVNNRKGALVRRNKYILKAEQYIERIYRHKCTCKVPADLKSAKRALPLIIKNTDAKSMNFMLAVGIITPIEIIGCAKKQRNIQLLDYLCDREYRRVKYWQR